MSKSFHHISHSPHKRATSHPYICWRLAICAVTQKEDALKLLSSVIVEYFAVYGDSGLYFRREIKKHRRNGLFEHVAARVTSSSHLLLQSPPPLIKENFSDYTDRTMEPRMGLRSPVNLRFSHL